MSRALSSLSRLAAVLLVFAGLLTAASQQTQAQDDAAFEQWLKHLKSLLPRNVADCKNPKWADATAKAAQSIDAWGARVGTFPANADVASVGTRVERLVSAHADVDRMIADQLALRKEFTKDGPADIRAL